MCEMNSFMTFLAKIPGWDREKPCYLHLRSSAPIWLVLNFEISLPSDSVTGTQLTVFQPLCCRGIQVKLLLSILTYFLRYFISGTL